MCLGLFLIKLQAFRPTDLQLYWKETQTHVYSCEYFKIFKNNYFEEHLQTAASELNCWYLPLMSAQIQQEVEWAQS